MLSRKRRASSISSRQDEDPLLLDDSTPEQSPVQQTQSARKKRRLDPAEMCQQLYDSIRNIKKEDGSMLCDTFIRAPKRRQEPSYYDVVVNPIDLLKVQQKLKTDSYDDLYDMMNDLELLISNAKAFYKHDSAEYQDAVALWQHIQTQRQRIMEANGFVEEEPRAKRAPRNARRLTGSTEPGNGDMDDDCNQYEELFASVMTATDPVGDRAMHPIFQLLPSKKIYPDYYDVIEHPIDLRLIATKIQMNAYSSLVEMERDLLQMTKNACLFNEPGSQIYKDAKALKRIFTQRRIELETGKGKPARRIKSLSSAAIAALKEEIDSSDDDETSKKGEGPMWSLFDHLYNAPGTSEHPGVTGPPLGNSLWKLPVRRFHPEYFELIKRPISMSQIHTKLKKGDYANISDLTGDFYLMLDNAKKAFPATHRTHKDALKMLKLMNAKLVEEKLEETSDLDEDESDDTFTTNVQPEKRKPGRPRVNSNSNSSAAHTSNNSNSPKSNRITINAAIKKKILSIQKNLVDFTVANRRPIEMFMEKPPRKIYPDYYDIIQNPIDMNTIEHNIRGDRYATVEDVVADYRLMFSNCRQYNEEGSNIYEDANTLERALNEKLKEFPGLVEVKRPIQKYNKLGRKPKAALLADRDRMWQFYESLRDFQEPKGKRQLSLIFTKLPSKSEYPEYYDIIKDPMDMERISQKLKQAAYESVDELAADFLLMLENACKYNEPDSQIYKDALVLQQLTLQLKQQMRTERDALPDVPLAVQELFLTLFTSVYNHQDEEGRCYSDSLAELPEYDDLGEGAKVRGISLDLVKRRLDKGAYKRLDIYQEDIFACMERARKLSRTDSDIFQDSTELQTYFIRKRDELCKDTLSSPALNFTLDQLLADVEVMRLQKVAQEVQEQEQDKDKDEFNATAKGESMTINQQVYSPGNYVYVQMPENKIPSIACIERLWTTPNNEKFMQASIFLRPHETFHVTTRKFLEKEVFKSSISQTVSMDKVLGMCYVMHIRDYIKLRPDGLPEKDVFVCESRYNLQGRCFKKLKNWPTARDGNNSSVRFVQRETPLELKRVMSVFKERIEKHKGELEELKLQETLVEKEKPNVTCDAPPNSEDHSIYYQQYNTICSGVIKTGDFVYVATQTGKQSVAQVQQIWELNGKSYFKGPWLLPPSETTPILGKQFYRQELLLSTVEDISPVIGIVGRCAVLEYAEFINSRPTEITESDVYICESVYDELKKALRNLVIGNLRKFQHSAEVTEDEIFYFKTPIKPAKDVKSELNELAMLEDSMDGDTPSLSSDIVAISSPAPSINSTPLTSKAKAKPAKKSLTGYILYSSDVRKSISQSNPDASFGDISRLVGNEWKSLPSSVKQSWEDRASKLNEEAAAQRREREREIDGDCGSPLPQNANSQDAGPPLMYECQWDKCDFQFEEMSDCTEHCLSDGTGHIQRHPQAGVEMEYVCLWRNCPRIRKSIQAFPNVLRLIKHVREVHLSKCGKPLGSTERGKNFVPRKQKLGSQLAGNVPLPTSNAISPRGIVSAPDAAQQPQQFQIQQLQQQQQLQTIVAAAPPEPLFVTVPPRANRVIHSEAYIKYIESLQTGSHLNVNSCNNNWRRSLSHVQPAQVGKAQLPEHWLGPNKLDRENVVQALCHLRNFMLDDVLEIQRSCN